MGTRETERHLQSPQERLIPAEADGETLSAGDRALSGQGPLASGEAGREWAQSQAVPPGRKLAQEGGVPTQALLGELQGGQGAGPHHLVQQFPGLRTAVELARRGEGIPPWCLSGTAR